MYTVKTDIFDNEIYKRIKIWTLENQCDQTLSTCTMRTVTSPSTTELDV
jgi:hypothetical protein